MNRLILIKSLQFVLLLIGCSQKAWSSTELRAIPLPVDSRLEIISTDLQQDGAQLEISKFYSNESTENVLSFYKALWYREGEIPGYVENTYDQWTLISHLTESHNIVLQLHSINQNKSEGYLSIATLNSNKRARKSGFPIQEDAETFSTSMTDIDGKDVITQILLTPQGVSDTVNFYRVRMQSSGWSLGRSSTLDGTEILVFNRGTDLCELAISRLNHASTVIFLNRVKLHG